MLVFKNGSVGRFRKEKNTSRYIPTILSFPVFATAIAFFQDWRTEKFIGLEKVVKILRYGSKSRYSWESAIF